MLSYPTTNSGTQNGSSVRIYTHCMHVFARLAPICKLNRCLLTKFLRRSSVGSLLRVLCWLGSQTASSNFSLWKFSLSPYWKKGRKREREGRQCQESMVAGGRVEGAKMEEKYRYQSCCQRNPKRLFFPKRKKDGFFFAFFSRKEEQEYGEFQRERKKYGASKTIKVVKLNWESLQQAKYGKEKKKVVLVLTCKMIIFLPSLSPPSSSSSLSSTLLKHDA